MRELEHELAAIRAMGLSPVATPSAETEATRGRPPPDTTHLGQLKSTPGPIGPIGPTWANRSQ